MPAMVQRREDELGDRRDSHHIGEDRRIPSKQLYEEARREQPDYRGHHGNQGRAHPAVTALGRSFSVFP